jgi:hypothetical protein
MSQTGAGDINGMDESGMFAFSFNGDTGSRLKNE